MIFDFQKYSCVFNIFFFECKTTANTGLVFFFPVIIIVLRDKCEYVLYTVKCTQTDKKKNYFTRGLSKKKKKKRVIIVTESRVYKKSRLHLHNII